MSAQNCSLKVATAFFTALFVFFALTGCGNKGPLYLPPEPVEEVTEAPTSSAPVPAGTSAESTDKAVSEQSTSEKATSGEADSEKAVAEEDSTNSGSSPNNSDSTEK